MIRGSAMDSSWPALCDAVYHGDLEAMRLLVCAGADVNDGNGWKTPLTYAVQNGNFEAVKFLVCNGADVNTPDRKFNTLLYSRYSGNSAIIEFLVSNGADVNIKSDDSTPLHYAARFGTVEFVEYLVRNGADVNATDKEGATPLHYAISSGTFESVKFLLDHGADIHAKDKCEETPIHWAVECRNIEMYDFLKYSDVWRRDDAVSRLSYKTASLLIRLGADLSAIDEEGKTPLHSIVYGIDLNIVSLLSDRDNLLKENKWNPEYDARYREFAKIIRLLLCRGADVNAKDKDGLTPLDLAKNKKCLEALQEVMHDMVAPRD